MSQVQQYHGGSDITYSTYYIAECAVTRMLLAVICVCVITTVFPLHSIHMLLMASVFKINPLPPSTITHSRFFGVSSHKRKSTPETRDILCRVGKQNWITCCQHHKHWDTKHKRQIDPFLPNYYMNTDSTFLNFAFSGSAVQLPITASRI